MKVVYKKRNFFYPICFIIAALLCAVCFMAWNNQDAPFLSKFVNTVVSPLQFAANKTANAVSGVSKYFFDLDKLTRENQLLKEQNKQLSRLQMQNEILRKQNDDLYGYLDLKRENTDYNFVNALIIARSGSNYTSTFTIDKGTFHGLDANMPIINSDGALLGIIISADAVSSKCLALCSYDMNVGVYNERTGNTGILSGDYEYFTKGKCIIKGLATDTDIQQSDRILTSGFGDVYPRDLVIGTVESIEGNMSSYTLSAVVAPFANHINEDNVMVITGFDKTYE